MKEYRRLCEKGNLGEKLYGPWWAPTPLVVPLISNKTKQNRKPPGPHACRRWQNGPSGVALSCTALGSYQRPFQETGMPVCLS